MIWWRIFFGAGASAHWRSFKEVFIVLVVSTSPLYLGALLHYYIDEGSPTYYASLKYVVQRGELFLYSMSIVSSIIWVANREWILEVLRPSKSSSDNQPEPNQHQSAGARVAPPKWIFNLFSTVAFGVCTMFFGIDYVKIQIRPAGLISLSSLIYAASIVLWYIINVLSVCPGRS